MSTLQIKLPRELIELAGAPGVIFMAPGELPAGCPNCGGHGILSAYRIHAGPFRQPAGIGSKYLTVDDKTGWWKGELVVGHCPVCQGGRQAEYLNQICGLEDDELTISLETFRTDGELAGKAQALAIAKSYMAQNRQPTGFLTVLGDAETNYGVGKSHILKGMVNGFRQIGVAARYTTLAQLLAELQQRFGREQVKTEDLVQQYARLRVLAIDELDKVDLLGYDRQRFFRLIDARHRSQSQQLTILAANAYVQDQALWLWKTDQHGRPAPEAWPTDLAYLESRILEGVIATLPGPDVRKIIGYHRQRQMEAA